MSIRRHPIARYHYAIDVSADGAGHLTLWDADGARIGDIGCLDEGAALPAPKLASDLSSAAAFIHASNMPALLDMLRNESNAVLCLDGAAPGYVTFETDADIHSGLFGSHAVRDG